MNDLPKQRPKTRYSISKEQDGWKRKENAYTEDKIPIKTIYVGNLSSENTAKEVKEYFLKFGSVASVAIKRTGSKSAPWSYAFVTFEELESAAKALNLEKHEILSRRVVVNVADSRNQSKEKAARDETSEMKFRLLHLNDDCLYHIGSYLELRDLLSLSKTCQRLECRLDPVFASYKKLDFDSLQGLTLVEMREILYKIGPHVQHIVFTEYFELNGRRLEALLKKYFVAVNIVSVDCSRVWCLGKTPIETYKDLETKCLITDDMIAALSNYSNLQSLEVYSSSNFTGKYLDKLTNVQNLNLNQCLNVRREFFKNLYMKTKFLSLGMVGLRRLDDSYIETLASTQTMLENLTISNTYKTKNLSPLAKLKNLKRLGINCFNQSCDEFFEELAKHRGAELEVLEITWCCFNQKVEQAIYSLTNLKVLTTYDCKNITSAFLNKLALTSLEYVAIFPLKVIVEQGILNMISKSETVKVIATDYFSSPDIGSLVRSAYEILKNKESKYPLSLFTNGPCIIDGIYHEEPILDKPRIKFRKIIKKLGYLGQIPWYNDFNIF